VSNRPKIDAKTKTIADYFRGLDKSYKKKHEKIRNLEDMLVNLTFHHSQRVKEFNEAGLKIQIYGDLLARIKTREFQLVNDLNCLQRTYKNRKKSFEEKNVEMNIYVSRCDELTRVLKEMNQKTRQLSNQLVLSRKEASRWQHKFEDCHNDLLLTRKTYDDLQIEHDTMTENVKIVATRYELLEVKLMNKEKELGDVSSLLASKSAELNAYKITNHEFQLEAEQKETATKTCLEWLTRQLERELESKEKVLAKHQLYDSQLYNNLKINQKLEHEKATLNCEMTKIRDEVCLLTNENLLVKNKLSSAHNYLLFFKQENQTNSENIIQLQDCVRKRNALTEAIVNQENKINRESNKIFAKTILTEAKYADFIVKISSMHSEMNQCKFEANNLLETYSMLRTEAYHSSTRTICRNIAH